MFSHCGPNLKREIFISQKLEGIEKNGQRETFQRPIKPPKAHIFGLIRYEGSLFTKFMKVFPLWPKGKKGSFYISKTRRDRKKRTAGNDSQPR